MTVTPLKFPASDWPACGISQCGNDNLVKEKAMRISTLDPMTLNDVHDLERAPFVIEGEGDNAIKIYFESEASRDEYLDLEIHGSDGESGAGMQAIFQAMADNPDTGSIN